MRLLWIPPQNPSKIFKGLLDSTTGRRRNNFRKTIYVRGELFMRSREGYFGVYFPSCAATREINTKITLEWVHKQFVTRVHTLFYFLHNMTNPWMTLKRGSSHIIPVMCLTRFTLCWWRHNRLAMTSQWPDNCDANTWQVISNELDIDFIHGDIHGRSHKNKLLPGPMLTEF